MTSSPGLESRLRGRPGTRDVDGNGWSLGPSLVSPVQTVSPRSLPSPSGPALPCGGHWGGCLHPGDGDRGGATWLASASGLCGAVK